MKKSKKKPDSVPVGIDAVDRLANLNPVHIDDYVRGVSAYVRESGKLNASQKKASQIRLSHALAIALATDLEKQLPQVKGRLITDECTIAGGLRTARADVSESHQLDGLRLAIELKPVNLAVGRALWNRFGDIRTFAVNIHLKFPFAVVGGVLVIPIYEESGTKQAKEAAKREEIEQEGGTVDDLLDATDAPELDLESKSATRKDTIPLIKRAIERLIRAGGRKSEADAHHLLEGIAVVVYDPDSGAIEKGLPPGDTGLRWEDFIQQIASAYRARFED